VEISLQFHRSSLLNHDQGIFLHSYHLTNLGVF
jgi:hypothetical protein